MMALMVSRNNTKGAIFLILKRDIRKFDFFVLPLHYRVKRKSLGKRILNCSEIMFKFSLIAPALKGVREKV
jgi:hypothetical protein